MVDLTKLTDSEFLELIEQECSRRLEEKHIISIHDRSRQDWESFLLMAIRVLLSDI